MSNFQFYESRIFSGILHIIAIGQFFYAMHFNWNLNIPDVKGVPKMLKTESGGMSKFLTYWCLVSVNDFSFGSYISYVHHYNWGGGGLWGHDDFFEKKLFTNIS